MRLRRTLRKYLLTLAFLNPVTDGGSVIANWLAGIALQLSLQCQACGGEHRRATCGVRPRAEDRLSLGMSEPKRRPAKAAIAVLNRLLQMRQLWDDAAASYFDPARFQLNLQNCITVSRTVTFILQSNKSEMNGFDGWYEDHVNRWRADPIMSWARDARNSIEKQGDLETRSQVRATIIASYLDGQETRWMPQALFSSPEQIYRAIPARFFIPHIVEHGSLLIERRWVANTLPDTEVLEALAHVYEQLADLLHDYLKANRLRPPALLDRSRPKQMKMLAMDRAVYLSMADGAVIGHRFFALPVRKPDTKAIRRSIKRYGEVAKWKHIVGASTLREVAEAYFINARVVLKRDGFHRPLMFFLKGPLVLTMISMDHPDRRSRYILMRDLAKLCIEYKADGMMLIGESWVTRPPRVPASGFAVDDPHREEAITLHAADARGQTFLMQALFHRKRPGSKKIASVEPALVDEDTHHGTVAPFLREWGVLDERRIDEAEALAVSFGVPTPFVPGEASSAARGN